MNKGHPFECSHYLCEKCLGELKYNELTSCPICREKVELEYDLNPNIR